MGNVRGMPWHITELMSQRLEFVLLARAEGADLGELCRRFGISMKTGWKWRRRFAQSGAAGLTDRSRRPHRSPRKVGAVIAAKVIALRREHPAWGGRTLRQRLRNLGCAEVPAASTCTEILRRAELLGPNPTHPGPFLRFERSAPNELWQMDHKGHFATQCGQRCHPLTVLDDHSRFNLLLHASRDETGATVRTHLTRAFELYGLPEALLCDNGPPWGSSDATCPYTRLTVWLLRLGVRVLHGRPYHPQTQGKNERFHRTLNNELLRRHTWRDLAHCNEQFQHFRDIYNCERPHHSLGGATPVSRYRQSRRSLPAALPAIEFPAGALVRRVPLNGSIMFGGQTWYVGQAFGDLPIGLCADREHDGHWHVYFASTRLGRLDLTTPRLPRTHKRSIYLPKGGEADRLPCHPSAQSGKGREPSPLP